MYINLGLIGRPLSHTFSPSLHTFFLNKSSTNGGYACFETESKEELPAIIEMFQKYRFRGVNVTVPYKVDIMGYCSELDKTASSVGAVNTLFFDNGRITGYNTDIFGVEMLFQSESVDISGKKVLLLGAGGAARSVTAYMNDNKPLKLTIANRTSANAVELAARCEFDVETADFGSVSGRYYDIIINSTSIGLDGGCFPDADLKCQVAIDLQYKPKVTKFLERFEGAVKKVNGFAMLYYQALRSFQIWTGKGYDFESLDELMMRVYSKL